MKTCKLCKQLLPFSAFCKHPRMKDRHQAWCTACTVAHNKKRNNENKEQYLLTRAKSRAKRKGIPCTITVEDIFIPDKCPIFNRPFDEDRFCPSLDRIDNSKGYIPGNIQVISRLANTMKLTATEEELLAFCQGYLSLKSP